MRRTAPVGARGNFVRAVAMKRFFAAVAHFFRFPARRSAAAVQACEDGEAENLIERQGVWPEKLVAADPPREFDPWGLSWDAVGARSRATPESAATQRGVSRLSPVGRAATRHRRIFDAAQETTLDAPNVQPKEEGVLVRRQRRLYAILPLAQCRTSDMERCRSAP